MEPYTSRKKTMNDMVVVSKKTTVVSHASKKVLEKSSSEHQTHDDPYTRTSEKKIQPITLKQQEKMSPEKKPMGCALWIVGLVALVAILVVAGGLIARATVTIVPWSQAIEINQDISFSTTPQPGKVFFATAQKTFTETMVISTATTASTNQSATGTVRFFNKGSSAVTIPAKTIIKNQRGYEYIIDKKLTVSAMKQQIPGSTDSMITAIAPGARFNSQPNDFLLPESFPETLQVKSVTPISGGIQISELQTSPEVLDTTIAEVKKLFVGDTLIQRMKEEIPDTFLAVPESISRTEPRISIQYDKPDGIHVIGEQTITLGIISKSDLAHVLLASQNHIGYTGEALSLEKKSDINLVVSPTLQGSAIPSLFQGSMTGNVVLVAQIDPKIIIKKIKGISRIEAKAFLDTIPEIRSFSLRMMPPWRFTVPFSENDIIIKVKNE